MSHTAIWDAVCKTDPARTKSFSRSGGFRGTATNATYQAQRATEVFGPAGIGWGVEVVNEEILEGAPIIDEGAVLGHEKVHKVLARLWYVYDGQRGEVYQFGQTTFVERRRSGAWFTDEEAPKKSLTDAMTKALSLLGFSADIHLGMYDDNKYVAKTRADFEEAKAAEEEKTFEAVVKAEVASTIAALVDAASKSRADFDKAWKGTATGIRKRIKDDAKAMAKLKATLEASDAAKAPQKDGPAAGDNPDREAEGEAAETDL